MYWVKWKLLKSRFDGKQVPNDRITKCLGNLGYIVCHVHYAKYLRSKGIVMQWKDFLDYDKGIGVYLARRS